MEENRGPIRQAQKPRSRSGADLDKVGGDGSDLSSSRVQ